ncbi:TPA: hypothetical protein N0F65_011199 [Lagenidium giganteum]|uniref:Uncharacterized protein n=1 Tax=Lagenidium giganteum TaxID=4803 RepID=A0AAV2Z8Z4_9STRA|nr:TPA: hypothetical protein N0F65_011199 [Lagenidium giganteum]
MVLRMLEMMKYQMRTQQQQLIDRLQARPVAPALVPHDTIRQLDGTKLPTYLGGISESFELYIAQVAQYFDARGFAWRDPTLFRRTIAILVGTLKHAAAQ